MQPDNFMENLMQGIIGALNSKLTVLTLHDSPLLASNIQYGYADPQAKNMSLPIVAFYDVTTLPAPTPGLISNYDGVYNPTSGTQGILSTVIRYFHTMVDFNIWTTNVIDRTIISSGIHSVLDVYPFHIMLPNNTTTKTIFQKEIKFPTEPTRHLYRSCLTYLCKHHMIQNSTQYTFLHPNPTYDVQ